MKKHAYCQMELGPMINIIVIIENLDKQNGCHHIFKRNLHKN